MQHNCRHHGRHHGSPTPHATCYWSVQSLPHATKLTLLSLKKLHMVTKSCCLNTNERCVVATPSTHHVRLLCQQYRQTAQPMPTRQVCAAQHIHSSTGKALTGTCHNHGVGTSTGCSCCALHKGQISHAYLHSSAQSYSWQRNTTANASIAQAAQAAPAMLHAHGALPVYGSWLSDCLVAVMGHRLVDMGTAGAGATSSIAGTANTSIQLAVCCLACCSIPLPQQQPDTKHCCCACRITWGAAGCSTLWMMHMLAAGGMQL